MTINLILCVVLFCLFILIIPIIVSFCLRRHKKALKIVAIISFVVYLFFLFYGTLCKISIDYPDITFDLKFDSPWFSLYFLTFNFGKTNVLINLVIFLPIGFFVYATCDKKCFLKTILLSFFLSVFIELLQWILPVYRNTEILDVILNTISGLLSALLCQILYKMGAFRK